MCFQHSLMVPAALSRIQFSGIRQESSNLNDIKHAAMMLEMSILGVNLKSDLAAVQSTDDKHAVLGKAVTLVNVLERWPSTLSPHWHHTTIRTPHSAFGEVYVYSTPWIHRIWTYWRLYRVLVNQAIFHCTESDSQREAALSIVAEASLGFCASIDMFGKRSKSSNATL